MIIFLYIYAKPYSLYRYLELCVQLHTFYKIQENELEEIEIVGETSSASNPGMLFRFCLQGLLPSFIILILFFILQEGKGISLHLGKP